MSALTATLDALASALGSLARRDAPLGALTTYRVGGRAALLVTATGEDDLLAVRHALGAHRVPVLVLGKGSNLLVSDAGFPGLVVQPAGELTAIDVSRPGSTVVRAGGAAGLPVVARRSVEAGLSGFEWAVGVPGSVGGALKMNAGGHGSDVAASLVRYRWVDLCSPQGGEEGPERLALAYRASTLTDTEVVVWAEFALAPGDPEAGQALLREIVRWRRAHQPGGSNAGSVFVNPPGDSAGRLVDAAGLKGLRLGTAAVSEKHANFIQADDGGSADDVHRLIAHVRSVVAERFGIDLACEVRQVGFPAVDNGRHDDPADPPGSPAVRPMRGAGP